MTSDESASRGFSLKRWSQRKLQAARGASVPTSDAAASAAKATTASAPTPPAQQTATTSAAGEAIAAAPALPPIESLTIDSDFSVFFGPRVDPAIKLQALKKLFRDPRFNVMDGLDVYIDDYSIAEPLAPELARKLAHARYVFDPPRTRVNEAGIVEDVAEEEASTGAGALPQETATMPPEAMGGSENGTTPEAAPSPAPSVALNSDADSATGEGNPREGSEPARR
jgi:hypothetical protein